MVMARNNASRPDPAINKKEKGLKMSTTQFSSVEDLLTFFENGLSNEDQV
jgi:hypothetical protein